MSHFDDILWTYDSFEHFAAMYPTASEKVKWRVFERDQNKCVYCGLQGTLWVIWMESKKKIVVIHHDLAAVVDGKYVMLTRDHVIPRTKGGASTADNLACACAPCNHAKGNKLLTNN